MSTQAYQDELRSAMTWLSQHKDTVFLGQAVRYGGTGCYDSLVDVPLEQKLEFPVCENFQIGVSVGIAMQGLTPISIVPRWNFLLCAADQIVNHLDKMILMSDGACRPKVIIRVAVGSENPIDPQQQHRGNFSQAFRQMCDSINIVELRAVQDIMPAYQHAYHRQDGISSILVEFPDYGK